MHILVAGGTGFIGRHLVEHLKLHGHKVTTVSRFKKPNETITWQELRFGQAPKDATHLVNLSGNAWEGWNSYSDRNHLDVKGSSTSAMEKFETSRLATAAVCKAYGDASEVTIMGGVEMPVQVWRGLTIFATVVLRSPALHDAD